MRPAKCIDEEGLVMSCLSSFPGTRFVGFRRSHGNHPLCAASNRGDVDLCHLHHRIERALGIVPETNPVLRWSFRHVVLHRDRQLRRVIRGLSSRRESVQEGGFTEKAVRSFCQTNYP